MSLSDALQIFSDYRKAGTPLSTRISEGFLQAVFYSIMVIPFLNQDDIEEARKRRRRCTVTYSEEPMTQPTRIPLD
jgi:hypothetical protein